MRASGTRPKRSLLPSRRRSVAKTLGPACGAGRLPVFRCRRCSGAPTMQSQQYLFRAWYLQQMRAMNRRTRSAWSIILICTTTRRQRRLARVAGGASTAALRLRSTRSLWDPSYVDESWIPIPYAHPRMRDWGDELPWDKARVSEYNWGGLEHINGALAQADVLASSAAKAWASRRSGGRRPPANPVPMRSACIAIYTAPAAATANSASSASAADQDKLAVYAGRRSRDHAVTVTVITKTASDLTRPSISPAWRRKPRPRCTATARAI